MTVYQMRKLASQYANDAEECAYHGFRTIATVNRGMAEHYYSLAAAKKADSEVNSDTD